MSDLEQTPIGQGHLAPSQAPADGEHPPPTRFGRDKSRRRPRFGRRAGAAADGDGAALPAATEDELVFEDRGGL